GIKDGGGYRHLPHGFLSQSAGVDRAQRIIKKAARDLAASKGPEVAVAYQSVVTFVPQTEGERLQAGEQRDGLRALKQRIRSVALLQVVVGNARTQVMNVMKADVA